MMPILGYLRLRARATTSRRPMILLGIREYDFHPLSSSADIYGNCTPAVCLTSDISVDAVVRGSWGIQPVASKYQNLAPGVYTVMAGDEWGNLEFLYFIAR